MHNRFDFAVLSFFTYAMLATPFEVKRIAEDRWEILHNGGKLGEVTYHEGGWFKAHRTMK